MHIAGVLILTGLSLGVVLAAFGRAIAARDSTTAVDKARFADSWKALMAIESATSIGVTISEFRPLVQDYASALAVLARDLSPGDAQVAAKLLDIVQAYKDSTTLWARQIHFSIYDPHKGLLIPMSAVDVPMIDKYELQYTGSGQRIGSDSIQQVWAWASSKTDELRPLLTP